MILSNIVYTKLLAEERIRSIFFLGLESGVKVDFVHMLQ